MVRTEAVNRYRFIIDVISESIMDGKRKPDDTDEYPSSSSGCTRKRKRHFVPGIGWVSKSKFYNLRNAELLKNVSILIKII